MPFHFFFVNHPIEFVPVERFAGYGLNAGPPSSPYPFTSPPPLTDSACTPLAAPAASDDTLHHVATCRLPLELATPDTHHRTVIVQSLTWGCYAARKSV